MAILTLRSQKGSPLTSTELDNNFTNLNTDIASRISSSGLLNSIKDIDGSGSGIDADLLRGLTSSSALPTATDKSSVVLRDSSGNIFAAGITGTSLTSTSGGLSVTGSQTLVGATLGSTSGNQTLYQRYQSIEGTNVDYLEITNTRSAGGSDWTTAGTRLQQKVDATWMSYIQFNGNGNTGGISIGTGINNSGPLTISEAFRILSSGNVGIGTLNPTDKLQVSGTNPRLIIEGTTVGGNPGLVIKTTAPNNRSWEIFQRGSNGDFGIYDGIATAERFVINPSGNIGINVASATTKLHTRVATGNSVDGMYVDNGTSWLRFAPSHRGGDYNSLTQAGDSGITFGGTAANTGQGLIIAPWNEASAGIRIANSGNVGIGSQTAATEPLDVKGNIKVEGIIKNALADSYIQTTATTSSLSINGGTGYGQGGQITLRGGTAASNAGGVDFFVGTGPRNPLSINKDGLITVSTSNRLQGTDTGSIKAPGMVIQTVYLRTDLQSAYLIPTYNTTAPYGGIYLADMSTIITPKYSNSAVYVQWNPTFEVTHDTIFRLFRSIGGSDTEIGRNTVAAAGPWVGWASPGYDVDSASTPRTNHYIFLDFPNSTSAVTYKFMITSAGAGANNYYCQNRTLSALGQASYEVGISQVILQEIAQ